LLHAARRPSNIGNDARGRRRSPSAAQKETWVYERDGKRNMALRFAAPLAEAVLAHFCKSFPSIDINYLFVKNDAGELKDDQKRGESDPVNFADRVDVYNAHPDLPGFATANASLHVKIRSGSLEEAITEAHTVFPKLGNAQQPHWFDKKIAADKVSVEKSPEI
jgi:hypothetical protein